ncbi:MAG: DEAD/DEAH box helicase [Deltaproteobacteria bacterium]|nr:DEAD/DEAH box helicase [Deltaproteobacteria bacterium]MBN2670822.1 DEAD/DEAH box helicase [Deltaproteobacteria bacterium]
MSFQNLGLHAELLQTLQNKGYKEATPIQAQAIPPILEGNDVLGRAQTGTGKTAAFALPILQILENSRTHDRRHPRALIVTPTRELAIQVAEAFKEYGKGIPLKTAVVYGGVGMNPQIDKLSRGVDILIATPGRLLDLYNRENVYLKNVEILVLDEADRMLDMGFIDDIRKIVAAVPKKRQSLLFSATYAKPIMNLAQKLLYRPVRVEVTTRNETAQTVKQVVYKMNAKAKRGVLRHLIATGNWKKVLVFTRTKYGANRLADYLNKRNVPAIAIHGNKSQNARNTALDAFKKGDVVALVATDVAARGLDVNDISHVVNYELPQVAEDYVHRIGRTGRAGAEGDAVSLVSPDEKSQLKQIENLTRQRIPVWELKGPKGETISPEQFVDTGEPPPKNVSRKPYGNPTRNRRRR